MDKHVPNGHDGHEHDDVEFVTEADDLEALYSPEYLRACAEGNAREERLQELRRRIALGAYRIDPERVAEELLRSDWCD